MSEVKVDTISERTADNGVAVDGVTIKDSGLTIPSGGTLDVASGGEIDIASGATLDVNGTIDATGATVTGFGESSYKILKLAYDVSSTTYSTTSSSWYTTNLSISYTPLSASSTLIIWGVLYVGTANNAHGYAGLVIDGSTYQYGRFGGNFQGSDAIPVHYALSTVSTSTKTIGAKFLSGSGTTYFNTGPYGTHGSSYLTVMEVIYNSD